GWALPRYEALRIYASTASEFEGLATTVPSLVRLIRAPAMTHISIIPMKPAIGFLIVLFHLPRNSTAHAFEKAFLEDLNHFRKQMGHRPVRTLTRPPAKVVETDCASAIKTLKQLVRTKSRDQLWLQVSLNDTTEHEHPSCNLKYGLPSINP
ncbi:MAG: hypothetical protein ACPGQS_07890, partial [Bradymonadia bacterium]